MASTNDRHGPNLTEAPIAGEVQDRSVDVIATLRRQGLVTIPGSDIDSVSLDLTLGAKAEIRAGRSYSSNCFNCYFGAPRETRTPDPLITNQMLYQLSYRGTQIPVGIRPAAFKRHLLARAARATAARPTAITSMAAGAAWPICSSEAFS